MVLKQIFVSYQVEEEVVQWNSTHRRQLTLQWLADKNLGKPGVRQRFTVGEVMQPFLSMIHQQGVVHISIQVVVVDV